MYFILNLLMGIIGLATGYMEHTLLMFVPGSICTFMAGFCLADDLSKVWIRDY